MLISTAFSVTCSACLTRKPIARRWSGRSGQTRAPPGSGQAAPSLRLDLPFVDFLHEREGEYSGPTATLAALEPKGKRRGEDDVGVRSDNRGVKDSVACDGFVLDIKVVDPFLCVGKPTVLSIGTCPAVRS